MSVRKTKDTVKKENNSKGEGTKRVSKEKGLSRARFYR
jgi:hypothetical protein